MLLTPSHPKFSGDISIGKNVAFTSTCRSEGEEIQIRNDFLNNPKIRRQFLGGVFAKC